MPSIESPVAFRAAIVLAAAGALLASVPVQAADGPAVAPAAPEAAAPEAPVAAWGDRLWNAARTGESATVDRLLAEMPEGADPEASRRFRDAVSRRSDHMAATAKEVEQQRAEKLKEMNEAVAAGNATKALIGAAYLKFLGSDWKSTIGTPEVRAAVALAEKRVDEACAAGDWLLAEELLNRLRSLYEGTPDREAYDRFDARLETDIGRRVMLVLEYAPRAWYELRRRQWERLDEKDRKEPFPPYNEKSSNDWKQALEGINERILADALGQVAAQHLENIGWKPLLAGGLGMVERLATTPALKENFPSLGDAPVAAAFAKAVAEQSAQLAKLRDEEVDVRTFGRIFKALRESNDATV
jgi:hypothetical protein